MKFPKRDETYLRDMLAYAGEAVEFAKETTLEVLKGDTKTLLALERAIEIVGEAAKSISDETKAQIPELPWREMIRTRDMFAHHYFKIDLRILWQIATESLPEVVEILESILDD